jgi:hypothetical protein
MGGSGLACRIVVRGETDSLEWLLGRGASGGLTSTPGRRWSSNSAGGVDGDVLWPPRGLASQRHATLATVVID